MIRILTLVFIILFWTVYAVADDVSAPKGKIKGSVADAKTEQPLEYATIALYNAKNDKLVTGAITDYLGHFKLEQPENGDYYLVISFIGLKEQKSQVFKVTADEDNINLGHFFLESAAKELGEVEVVSKRAPIEYKIDKKVINVDKQITAEAGTAVDILENVPSVQVDVDGNVSLRGSSGFTVLIDGKPTILEPSDVLRQIPSSSIENIEIITNPSVKYEPDGGTGIINVITKKNRLDGLSGNVNANAGTLGQYSADLQLSYRLNKVNFIFGGSVNRRPRPGSVSNSRITSPGDTSYYITSEGDTDREWANSNLRAGIEFDATKYDFISLSGRYGRWDMNNESQLRYNEWTEPATFYEIYNSEDGTTRGGNYYSLDAVYQHTFKNGSDEKNKAYGSQEDTGGAPSGMGNDFGSVPGFSNGNVKHVLKTQFMYRHRYIDEESQNLLRELDGQVRSGTKNVEKGPSTSRRLNIDYTLPVGEKDKFEAGAQWRSGKSTDITELWLYNDQTGEIEYTDEYSNSTEYYRNIYAVYALYAGYLGNFGYQAGLRGEYTDRKIEMTGQDPFTINRWDYFPTLHFSYNLPFDQQVMASYSRRIDRPRSWWLEPFITVEDAFNVRQGNPDLQPEYIDSYDLGYLKKFGDNFFSLEGYYRVTHNKVERVSSPYSENIMLERPENIGEDYSLGVEAMLTFALFNWWDMEISGNFFNYRMKGELSYPVGDEIVKDPVDRFSTNWNTRFNNTFRIWDNGTFQLNSRYNSASVTAQGTREGFFDLDAAFKVTFLNKSLSANLQGRNILGTARRAGESRGTGFYSSYEYIPVAPVFILSVSYRFNNFKPNRRAGQNGGQEDEF